MKLRLPPMLVRRRRVDAVVNDGGLFIFITQLIFSMIRLMEKLSLKKIMLRLQNGFLLTCGIRGQS